MDCNQIPRGFPRLRCQADPRPEPVGGDPSDRKVGARWGARESPWASTPEPGNQVLQSNARQPTASLARDEGTASASGSGAVGVVRWLDAVQRWPGAGSLAPVRSVAVGTSDMERSRSRLDCIRCSANASTLWVRGTMRNQRPPSVRGSWHCNRAVALAPASRDRRTRGAGGGPFGRLVPGGSRAGGDSEVSSSRWGTLRETSKHCG